MYEMRLYMALLMNADDVEVTLLKKAMNGSGEVVHTGHMPNLGGRLI
jgi:hypothetical protein